MKTTDFDSLLAGLSVEESRRLHKLLAEWARGDEGSFPVQLALITRAQWRVAATIPKLMEEQRRLLAGQLTATRREEAATAERIQEVQRVQLTKLEAEVTRSTNTLREAGIGQHVELAKAVAVANDIRTGLREGETSWKKAAEGFRKEQERLGEMMAEIRKDREAERSWAAWVAIGIVALLGFGAGVFTHAQFVAKEPAAKLTPGGTR